MSDGIRKQLEALLPGPQDKIKAGDWPDAERYSCQDYTPSTREDNGRNAYDEDDEDDERHGTRTANCQHQ